jgi:Protein of unknown function (DUF3800)
MSVRVYVFGDEGGDFAFVRKAGASRYFIIGTATMGAVAIGDELLALRRELGWHGTVLHEFHARNDKPRVRERVFDLIAESDVRIDATVLDKTKTQDHLRANHPRFYKQAWFLHAKYVVPQVVKPLDELFVVASSLQIRSKKRAIHLAIQDVVGQVSPTAIFHTAFWPAASDPCLQVADYATWAIQRRLEANDDSAHSKIAHLIASEFEPFKSSAKTYY